MAKKLTLNPEMLKRIRRRKYEFDRKDRCLVCGQVFQDCPHTFADNIDSIALAVQYEGLEPMIKSLIKATIFEELNDY